VDKLLICIPTVPQNREVLMNCLDSIGKNTTGDYVVVIGMNDFISFSYGCNQGMRLAQFDEDITHVSILNDDVVVLKGWNEALMNKIKQGYDAVGDMGTLRYGGRDKEHLTFWNIMFNADVIRKIGILDEGFKLGEWEDVDYCVRMKELNMRFAELDEKVCRHIGRYTTEKLQSLDESANREFFMKKWQPTKWAEVFK